MFILSTCLQYLKGVGWARSNVRGDSPEDAEIQPGNKRLPVKENQKMTVPASQGAGAQFMSKKEER